MKKEGEKKDWETQRLGDGGRGTPEVEEIKRGNGEEGLGD